MNINQVSENLRMGWETLRSHKMRSFLTVLGVIIGVLTVIVIASILTGMRQNIIGLVEQYGTHNIYAFHLSTGPQLGPRDRKEWQRKPLTVEDAEAVKIGAPDVEEVTYQGFYLRRPVVKYRDRTYRQAELRGVAPNFMNLMNLPLDEGRFITETDDRRRNDVAVLGASVVEALFPNYTDIVGRVIEIDGNQFTVIGTVEKRQATFLGSNEEDQEIYIPYRTFRKIAPRADFLLLIARAREGRLAAAMGQIEAVLRRQRGLRYDEDNNFDLTTSDRIIEQFDSITATAGLIAIAVSGVGLLVGGIGVMNIMLVSVTERTREIGVRKAIGARRRDITLQFLFEAMTLTTSGGLLGVILAILVSYLLTWLLPALPSDIPVWAVVTGVTVSMAVGLVFGVWPAVKAARLDPIEALRYE
ncbi:MAG: ABC transporter permease [Acidobacteriota bacterium]